MSEREEIVVDKEIEIPGMEELETVSEVEKKTATDMEICRKEDFSVIDEQSNIKKNRQAYMLRNLVKWMMVMRNRFIQVRM